MECTDIIENRIPQNEHENHVGVDSGAPIHKAIKYINEHYTESLSLDKVIKIATMSRTAFAITFKQVTGETFVEYIHLRRVCLAKQLFQENKYNITQIGKMCGFESTTYFCRIFLKYTGMTPRTYIAHRNYDLKKDQID